jgi:hypothetical protein
MARISGTIQDCPRLWRMIRNQGNNWFEEQEAEATWTSNIIGLCVLAAGIAVLLFGIPIVAAVLGVR